MRFVQWEYRETVRRVYIEAIEPPTGRPAERIPSPRAIPLLSSRNEPDVAREPSRLGTGSAIGLGSAAGAAIVLVGLAASRANRRLRVLPPGVRPAALGREIVHRLRAVPAPRALSSGTIERRDA